MCVCVCSDTQCSVISSFYAHFLQIHLFLSFTCLLSALLLFLGNFPVCFTYIVSKFSILRCKDIHNSEDSLVWNTEKLWVVLYEFCFRIRDIRNLQLVSHKYLVRKEENWLSFRDCCFSLQSFFKVGISTLEGKCWGVHCTLCFASPLFGVFWWKSAAFGV